MYKYPALLLFTLLSATFAWANVDQAAIDKQITDLERRETRERQKIDQGEEREMIKVRSRERDELARIERENQTASMAIASAAMSGGKGGLGMIDPTAMTQAKFLEDELHNARENQWNVEVSQRFEAERKALERKIALERATIDAGLIEGEDADKQRAKAIKAAEITASFQEKLDAVSLAQAKEESALRHTRTTKINAAEHELALLMAKQMLKSLEKGDGSLYSVMSDPAYTKATAVRDDEKNALTTAIDELHAKFKDQSTDLENAREDELAKLNE